MMHKEILPESFDFGVPSVELIGVGSKGLDKTAMVKRASAFDDILDKIEKKANRTYLHVITTGAFEKYGPNANCDAWNGDSFTHTCPHPENSKTATITFDKGLSKYHDSTYMNGAVYQEHKTKREGVDPSGEIICARYNPEMQRGELLIAVDTEKWSDRLNKKANGQDIYLSIGADVPYDTCFVWGTPVLTERGFKSIDTIKVGDKVKTASGSFEEVEATMCSKAKSLVEIKTCASSVPIICTGNHPFMVLDTNEDNNRDTTVDVSAAHIWKDAKSLTENDYIVVTLDPTPTDNSTDASEEGSLDFAYIKGCLSASMLAPFGQEQLDSEDFSLNWSYSKKIALLAGFIDTTTIVIKADKGICVIVKDLASALYLQRICWDLSIRAVLFDDCTAYPGATRNNTFIEFYDIPMPLIEQSIRLRNCLHISKPYNKLRTDIIFKDNYAYIKVKSVRNLASANVPVYNLQVAVDPSYIVYNLNVHNCMICHRQAKRASEHCEHFTKKRGRLFDSGERSCVMNDVPSFYDISGVDVPADKIAFVLQKVASDETMTKEAFLNIKPHTVRGYNPIWISKSAMVLDKLAKIEKEIKGMIQEECPNSSCPEVFQDSPEIKKDFILKVQNYPSGEVIDACNSKGILLSPSMLFSIMANDCTEDEDKELLKSCDDYCCGDCSELFEDLLEQDDINEILSDDSFDKSYARDLILDNIISNFSTEFGVTDPDIHKKTITIIVQDRPKSLVKKVASSFNKVAEQELKNTYGRYLISFAAKNTTETCYNALRKVAGYGK